MVAQRVGIQLQTYANSVAQTEVGSNTGTTEQTNLSAIPYVSNILGRSTVELLLILIDVGGRSQNLVLLVVSANVGTKTTEY